MSGAHQGVFMNQRSFGPPAIGGAFGGGFYAGDISTTANGVATHHLVVGPLSTAETTVPWKNVNTATPGANSDINGPQNTADIIADGNSTVYPCAHFCNNLTIGGFSDFYLPARNELEVCYFNLKPFIRNNNTFSGINPNAVPARASNYTIGNPAQTSAADFQTFNGANSFNPATYFSSTQGSLASLVRSQDMYDGNTTGQATKNGGFNSRAVRRVAV